MNVLVIAHLKSGYEEWKSLFDGDARRADFCDESQTKVGRVDDNTALIALFDVDMEGMGQHLSNPEFQAMIEPYVDRHDVFTMEPLPAPG